MSDRANDASSLGHYEYVSLYETAFKSRKEDVRFFCELAARIGAPVLEYGAGAGRITLPLARAGHKTTAVDLSAAMLGRLSDRLEKSPKRVRELVRTRKGDMRRLRLGSTFPLVLATFNVVAHLATFRDMGRFLASAKAHLSPGGTLAFDVPLPHPEELEADPEALFNAPRFKHPDTGEWIRQAERFEYDPEKQQLLVESTYRTEGAKDGLTVPLVLRQWFPKELEAALHFEGFSQVETFADYTNQPGFLAQDSLVFVARV